MESFTITFAKKAAKQYSRLPDDYKTLVDAALYRLMQGQHLHLKPVEGEDDVFRVRVGKYRILFQKREQTLLIARIGTRGDIYK
jgi:mRNA interferase RelE/StbE